jgi:DNA-binding transcriptional ArsR family regulator
MELSKIKALKLFTRGYFTLRELTSFMGLSYSRVAAITRELIKEGYCEKKLRQISLSSSVKGEILKKLADKYELISLLGGSGELVLLALSKPLEAGEIQRRTRLAQSTVYQTLKRLTGIGAVRKFDISYSLADDPELRSFLDLLRREREARGLEPYAILIWSNEFKLKKVPAGKPARGALTAFSLFSQQGVEYTSPWDYYLEPQKEVSIEEILIHALACAEGKADTTMCAIFYLKNIDKIDSAKAKKTAKKMGILSLWIDLQNYAKGLPVLEIERFLPWDEFVEKASLYSVQVSLPPEMDKVAKVLQELGNNLAAVIHAYLFGGGNMLLRGLKKATKDLDIVVEKKADFLRVRDTLLSLGFEPLAKVKIISSDGRLNPSGIYVFKNFPRFDLFTRVICNALFLTEEMKKRAEAMRFGKLVIHLLSLEDVFLLKSITEREGDLEDMATIIRRGGGLNWSYILDTYFTEEKQVKKHFCFTMLENIELLQQREGISLPLHKQLLNHCIDAGILQALFHGKTNIKGIRELVDFPEHTIRNRVEKLAREGKISKRRKGGGVILSLTDLAETHFSR